MPKEFEDMVSKIKDSLRKSHPKWDEKQIEDAAYGSATKQWKDSHKGKGPNECFSFSVPIKITETNITEGIKDDDLFIEGIAINETVTRNGITYTAIELEKSAPSLVGKPILKDHEAKVDNIVGRVTEASFKQEEKGKINFKARIPDKEMKEKIKQGLVQEVSIGAGAEIIDKESKEKGKERIATNIQFYELSFVAIPGDPNAGISLTQALAESFKMEETIEQMMKCPECDKEFKTKAEMDKHMLKHTEEKMENEALQKQLQEAKERIEAMELERKTKLVESIIKIDASFKREELMQKDEKELEIIQSYEKKLKDTAKVEKTSTKAEVGIAETKIEQRSPLIVTAKEMYVLTNKDGTFPEVN